MSTKATILVLPTETVQWMQEGLLRYVTPAESVSCPTCKAAVGEFCQGRKDSTGTPYIHIPRRRKLSEHLDMLKASLAESLEA